MRRNPNLPPFDPDKVTRRDDGRDLWEVHTEAEAANRAPLPAQVAARLAAYRDADVLDRRAGSPAWRALIGPAFDHPEAAESLIGAPGIEGTSHRDVAMRALATHIFTDANCAVTYASNAEGDNERELAYGACLAHADRHAAAAGALIFGVRSEDRGLVATYENGRWFHASVRNVAAITGSRYKIDMPTSYALTALQAHADAGDPQAAVLFARTVLGRHVKTHVDVCAEMLRTHVSDDNVQCAMMLANLAEFTHDPAMREEAWALLVAHATTSPFAASRLTKLAGYDRERLTIARNALMRHLDDVVCATNLMQMCTRTDDLDEFAAVWDAGVTAAHLDRRASVQLARMANTPPRCATANDVLLTWDRPDDYQIAAMIETATDDARRDTIRPTVEAALARGSMLVTKAVVRYQPDQVDDALTFSSVVRNAVRGSREGANIAARMASGDPERARELGAQMRDAIVDGYVPTGPIAHIVNVVPSVGRTIAGVLADAAADNAEACVLAAGLASHLSDDASERLWYACLNHATSKGTSQAHAATRLPALAGNDPTRREAARDALTHLAGSNEFCATALVRLVDTDEHRREAWRVCVSHAPKSAHAASALVGLAEDDDERDIAWTLIEPHARTDAYCASALGGLHRDLPERREVAFDRCLAHPTSDSAAQVAAMLARTPADHERLWSTLDWAAERSPAVATALARAANTPQRRDLARRACLRHSRRDAEAAVSLRRLVETDEDRADAYDATRRHAPNNAFAAIAAYHLASSDRGQDEAAEYVRRHARNGSVHAQVMLPKIACSDSERLEALDTLADLAADHPQAASSLAAHAAPGSRHAHAAWVGCLTHIKHGNGLAAVPLANLAAGNPEWAETAWKIGLACSQKYGDVAASMVKHASARQVRELVPLLRRHATESSAAATALYAVWRDGTVDVPTSEVWDVLAVHAPSDTGSASALSVVAETDSEIQFAWECNLRLRFADVVCAFALASLTRSSADAVQATDALRFFGEHAEADAVIERVNGHLSGRQATA